MIFRVTFRDEFESKECSILKMIKIAIIRKYAPLVRRLLNVVRKTCVLVMCSVAGTTLLPSHRVGRWAWMDVLGSRLIKKNEYFRCPRIVSFRPSHLASVSVWDFIIRKSTTTTIDPKAAKRSHVYLGMGGWGTSSSCRKDHRRAIPSLQHRPPSPPSPPSPPPFVVGPSLTLDFPRLPIIADPSPPPPHVRLHPF
jgi:hypothetical protein